MDWLRKILSSLVFRITALTLTALILMFACLILLLQTSFLTQTLYPRTLSDNADSIAELLWLVETSPDEMQPFILSAYIGSYRTAVIGDDFAKELKPHNEMRNGLIQGESDVASRLGGRDIRFQSLGMFDLQTRLRKAGANSIGVIAALQVAIRIDDGRVLNVWLAPALTLRKRPAGLVMAGFLLIFMYTALGLAIAAVTLRPIRQLELDAARVELGDAGAAVSETGPVELRRVSSALNRMRERLTGLIREREQMVAAIAHDVRTGLTRIRLRMDEHGTVSAKDIEADLAQMEVLISDMLAYARAESPSRLQELIRLPEFVRNVAETAPHPIDCNSLPDDDFIIVGDPVALRRLFENLIENARRYGGGQIAIKIVPDEGGCGVRIEDNGPGLREDQLETVFLPFQRGESSRNRTTGGTGLGLGIARAIARAHGANLRIENRPEGGLVAIVHFPEGLKM